MGVLKIPCRCNAVGTVASCGATLTDCRLCQLAKTKVRSLMIGPPKVAPNWFWLKLGFCPATWKYGVASKNEFRRYSHMLPWNWLVPDFNVTFTTAPAACPNSA